MPTKPFTTVTPKGRTVEQCEKSCNTHHASTPTQRLLTCLTCRPRPPGMAETHSASRLQKRPGADAVSVATVGAAPLPLASARARRNDASRRFEVEVVELWTRRHSKVDKASKGKKGQSAKPIFETREVSP